MWFSFFGTTTWFAVHFNCNLCSFSCVSWGFMLSWSQPGLCTQHKSYKDSECCFSKHLCYNEWNEHGGRGMQAIKKKHFQLFFLWGSSTVKRHCIMSSNERPAIPLGKMKALASFPSCWQLLLRNFVWEWNAALVDLRNGFNTNGCQWCAL